MNCPKCGYVMDELDTECPRCKRRGDEAAEPQQPITQPPPQGASAPRRGLPEPTPISNTVVWLAALAPLLYFPLFGLFVRLGMSPGIADWVAFGVWVVINGMLVTWDASILKSAGHDMDSIGNTWMMHQYLFRRAVAVGGTNAYAYVWIVGFVLLLIGFFDLVGFATILFRAIRLIQLAG